MRTVVGYTPERKAIWSDNEPGGYARPQGNGGAQLGWFSGTVLSVGPSTEVRRETQRKRKAARERTT